MAALRSCAAMLRRAAPAPPALAPARTLARAAALANTPPPTTDPTSTSASTSTSPAKAPRVWGKLSCIGCGKMAEAIIGGVVARSGPEGVVATDIHTSKTEAIAAAYGVRATTDNIEAVDGADVVLIAVKPQTMASVLRELKPHLAPKVLLVSIAAGFTVETVSELAGHSSVARGMPNTAALINESMTVWTCTDLVSQQQREQVRAIFSAVGEELYVGEEEYLDMATALSGTGPAYYFMIMESMIDAGVHLGFPRDVARTLVLQTMRGAVNLAIHTNNHPATLRNDITSPGGTSAAALYMAERGNLRTVITDSVWAAYRRSLEMGGLDSNVGPGRAPQGGANRD